MRALLLSLLVAGCAGPNSQAAQPQSAQPATPRPIRVGDRAPEVALGKVTLVVFSATWSQPSKVLDYRIQEIWRTRQDKAFAIRAILIDDEGTTLESWRTGNGFTYPFEWDRDRRLATVYGIDTDAFVFVIDKGGVVRHVHRGHRDGDEQQIAAEVDALLVAAK